MEKSRCASNQTAYPNQTNMYDRSLNRLEGVCGEDLIANFSDDTEFLLNFSYPDHAPGYGFMTKVLGDAAITAPTGVLGSPSNPMDVALESKNKIYSNTFLNYRKVYLRAGEKMTISTNLDQPLSAQQRSRCASNPGGGNHASSYDTQVHIYSSSFERVDGVCGENMVFSAKKSDYYILHFAFAKQSVGYFEVSKL